MCSSRTSCSRRNRLPQTTDRRPPAGAAPAAVTRVATFILLAVAGVVALLFAVRLAAAAAGSAFSPFDHLGDPTAHASRAWLLAAFIVVLVVLVWLVLRHGEDTLWLPGESGGVLLPAAALARLAEQTACRHPEVVRAEASLRARKGAVRGTVRVYGRPLADPARLAAEVEPDVRGTLARVVGVAPDRLVVKPRILAVPQLKRYLP
jgi:hypothetical protein